MIQPSIESEKEAMADVAYLSHAIVRSFSFLNRETMRFSMNLWKTVSRRMPYAEVPLLNG